MREIWERNKIIAHCPIDIYIASNNSRYYYPYRLQPADRAREWARDQSLSLIVDSAIGDEEIGNAETLDAAHRVHADYIIPADTMHDQPATTESVREFLQLYHGHPCTATPLIPLQPPYAEHYRDLEGYSHYALGGIASMQPQDQITEIHKFRRVAGQSVHVHALGLGMSLQIVRALRDDQGLVDSLDLSTPEMISSLDKIADKRWTHREFEYPRGEDSSTIRGMYASAMAIQLNYMLSDLCSDEIVEDAYEQSTLSELCSDYNEHGQCDDHRE